MDYGFSLPIPTHFGSNGPTNFKPLNIGFSRNTGSDLFQLSVEMFGNKVEANFNLDDTFNNEMNNKDSSIDQTYDDDLNIIQIHQAILNKLKSDNNNINELKEKLRNVQQQKKQPQTFRKRVETIKVIDKLQKEINDILSDKKYNDYIEKTESIIDKYKKLAPIQVSLHFGVDENNNQDTEDTYRNNLIEEYLRIAEKYININVYQKNKSKNHKCPGCNHDLDKNVNIHVDGCMICPKCDAEIPIYLTHTESIDTDDHKNGIKKDSSDISNFEKRISSFNGVEPNNYPADLEEKIDAYFYSYGQISCKQIRELPLNADCRTRGNTSKKLLESILKSIGYTKMYEHSEWICHVYWGWVRHDTSYLNDKLRHDYMIAQPIIDANKGKRKSNINREYRLFRHLEKLKYIKLDIKDFRMIRTEESLKNHENIWFNHIVPGLSWDKPPYNYNPVPINDMIN